MQIDLTGARATALREVVADLCAQELEPLDLLDAVSVRVRRVMPFEVSAWFLTDPHSLLPTGQISYHEGADLSVAMLHNELVVPDVNKFAELHSQGRQVATLSEATGGRLDLSARHRLVHLERGLGDELRLLFRTGDELWGGACLTRAEDRGHFGPAEVAFAAELATELGHGLRRGLARREREQPELRGPGMIVLDANFAIESSTGEADAWLRRMPEHVPGSLPSAVFGVAMRAQTLAAGGEERPARARVRLSSGEWVLLHAAPLHGAGGAPQRTAVMLEAAERAQLAPLLMSLYGMTEREREVTRLLVRGLATDEIATRLSISRHTLRDHVKAIFAKAGVASRPELTALLSQD